jgi:DNA-binding PadR family transcriptional regulator
MPTDKTTGTPPAPWQTATPSPLALIVLWQLVDGPKHVYGIHKQLEEQGKDRVVNVRSRASLYQALERLTRLELVKVHETVRQEGYPDRIVYAITEAGQEAAREWLRDMLRDARNEYPDFIAAVSILFALAPDDARAQLEERLAARSAELAETERQIASYPELPRLFLLEEEYRRAILKAEVAWLRRVIADLRSGDLTWSAQWLHDFAAALEQTKDEGDVT